MSGSNVTFLFPDHTTALTGSFSKSEMLLGQVSFIQVSSICSEFTQPRHPLMGGSFTKIVRTYEGQIHYASTKMTAISTDLVLYRLLHRNESNDADVLIDMDSLPF